MVYSNYYNMNNNIGTQFLQQGLSFLGGTNGYSTMGGFQIGNMLGGTNFFTNCYGEVNYDKMAGAGVANALVSVGAQAFQSIRGEKEEKVDYTAELNNINKELNAKKSERNEWAAKKIQYEATVKTAEDTKSSLQEKLNAITISTLEVNVDKLKDALKTETDSTKQGELSKQLADAEKALNAAKAEKENLEKQIKEQEEIIETNKTNLKTADEKIEALEKEIRELETEKAKTQKGVDAETLDKADGNWLNRANKKCLDETYDENNKAKKNEVRCAFNAFVKAQKAGNKDEMTKYANIVIQMINSNPALKADYEKALALLTPYATEKLQ